MKVIVDAMGGDNAPQAVVEGCINALNELPALRITLTGRQEVIEKELQKYDFDA